MYIYVYMYICNCLATQSSQLGFDHFCWVGGVRQKKNCRIRYVFHEMFLHIPSGKHLQFAIENGVEIVDDYPVEKWWIFPYKSFSHGFPMVFPWFSHRWNDRLSLRFNEPLGSPGRRGEGRHRDLRAKNHRSYERKVRHQKWKKGIIYQLDPKKKKQVPPGKGRHFGDGHRICGWLNIVLIYLCIYLYLYIYIYNYIYKIIHIYIYIYISMYIWYMDVNLTIVNF